MIHVQLQVDHYFKNSASYNMQFAKTFMEALSVAITRKTSVMEHLTDENWLRSLYANIPSISVHLRNLGCVVQQVVHRFPHMAIIEIGSAALKNIGNYHPLIEL